MTDRDRKPDCFDDMDALRAAGKEAVRQAQRRSPPEGKEGAGDGEPEGRSRHLGAPFEFVAYVRGKTRGEVVLLLAIYIFRRTVVCKQKTVDLRGDELAELGIGRQAAHWALRKLEAAGIVRLNHDGPGRRTKITLLRWARARPLTR